MKFKLKYKLILGSQSPRRKKIFRMLGIDFIIFAPDIDEKKLPGNILPERVPEFLARKKSRHISARKNNHLVLSYDTGVFTGGEILGKPSGADEALKMLRKLNGKSHNVISGVSLARNGRVINSATERTRVYFTRIPDNLLVEYSRSREPLDKAGSYAIQGNAAQFIEKISGCYYNVVGVPIQKTIQLIQPYYY